MSESTLSTPRSEILAAVGAFFDYGRSLYQWTREQREQVYRCVRSGEREFYNPTGHSWSFLRLRLELSIIEGTANYDLPDGFAGFFDQMLSFTVDDNRLWPVRDITVQDLLRFRQNETLAPAFQEYFYAKEAKTPTGTTGQRFRILLYPTPQADGTLTGSYHATPDATTDSLPYAMGGEVHSEALLACCLAAAELERDKKLGPMRQRYIDRLAASIEHDRRTGPKSFGYNGDRSCAEPVSIYDLRGGTPTYNGLTTYFE